MRVVGPDANFKRCWKFLRVYSASDICAFLSAFIFLSFPLPPPLDYFTRLSLSVFPLLSLSLVLDSCRFYIIQRLFPYFWLFFFLPLSLPFPLHSLHLFLSSSLPLFFSIFCPLLRILQTREIKSRAREAQPSSSGLDDKYSFQH